MATALHIETLPVYLTVPQGRNWKVRTIGELVLYLDEVLTLGYADPGYTGNMLIFPITRELNDPERATKGFCAGVGMPYKETKFGILCPLPDVWLPSGSIITLDLANQFPEPAARVAFLLIED